MRNVVKEILRSLGVGYALMIPTNDWTISFIHNGYIIDIKVTKSLLTKVLYMSLFRYDDGKIVEHHKEELTDITVEELREIMKDFIEG